MLLLLDNGSRRPAAILNLRRLARHLGARLGTEVHPISAQHSSRIPPDRLDGVPAQTLEPFLRAQVAAGTRSFGILPVFFGPSRAISALVPEVVGRVAAELGGFDVCVADVLCPLPAGEPRLAQILADNVLAVRMGPELGLGSGAAPDVLLVDHGSPLPEVTAVRHSLALALTESLGDALGRRNAVRVAEAVMERREGAAYDFNGRLLSEVLDEIGAAAGGAPRTLVLAMQFISPGRHAGAGGDIATMVARAQARHRGLDLRVTRLVGEHPLFVDILAERAASLMTQDPGCSPT